MQQLKKLNKYNPNVPFIGGDLSDKNTFDKIVEIIETKKLIFLLRSSMSRFFNVCKRRFIKSKEHNPLEDNRNDLIFTFLIMVAIN